MNYKRTDSARVCVLSIYWFSESVRFLIFKGLLDFLGLCFGCLTLFAF